jgi:hypothetical protein
VTQSSGPGVRDRFRGRSLSFPSDAPQGLSWLRESSSCSASRGQLCGSVSWDCCESDHPKGHRREGARRSPHPAISDLRRKRRITEVVWSRADTIAHTLGSDESVRHYLAGGEPPDYLASAGGEPPRVRLLTSRFVARRQRVRGSGAPKSACGQARLLLAPKHERGPVRNRNSDAAIPPKWVGAGGRARRAEPVASNETMSYRPKSLLSRPKP